MLIGLFPNWYYLIKIKSKWRSFEAKIWNIKIKFLSLEPPSKWQILYQDYHFFFTTVIFSDYIITMVLFGEGQEFSSFDALWAEKL